ncbi:MAG: peptidylprolyl isomerase [Planctomycetes bacterium]|nr:peptidylprolyl isomerase [Planctomycetota bacterium]
MISRILLPTLFISLGTSLALAQLSPDRAYFGVNRPMPVTIAVPKAAEGEARIDLFVWGEGTPIATAHVVKGGADFAALFPSLWTQPPRVLYAQLTVGDTKVGPAVVLQPMSVPRKAVIFNHESRQAWFIDPTTNKANFDPRSGAEIIYTNPPQAFAGFRAWVDQNVVFSTELGDIEFRMRPDQAPNTVWNLLELVKGGFYTDINIHRIVPKTPTGAPFVIQFGDPTASGDGTPGYSIALEPSTLAHDFGVLSMARDDDPDTNGSQVFICLSREGTQRLDGKYTSFGEAVRGAEVITGLSKVETDPKTQKPLKPVLVKSAKLVPAAPFATGPAPVRPADATKER